MSDNRVTPQQKKFVVKRANGCCEYCKSQERFAIQAFSAEHIIPKSQNGETNMDNLALACQGCNNHKYNKIQGYDPVIGENVPLHNPRQQLWNDNFAWNNDFTLVIGLTPTGRATVETLQLNREGVVNLRRVLYTIAQHPPGNVNNCS